MPCASCALKLEFLNEPSHDKTNKMIVRPAKTQISLGFRPVWSESSNALNGYLRTQAFFMRSSKTLIRLGGCPGWSKSSLGAKAILLVLSWGGSNRNAAVNVGKITILIFRLFKTTPLELEILVSFTYFKMLQNRVRGTSSIYQEHYFRKISHKIKVNQFNIYVYAYTSY